MVIVLFLVLLAAAVRGYVSKCNLPYTLQFSAVLGESVFLHLPVPEQTHKVALWRSGSVILEENAEALQVHGRSPSRIKLFANGTGKISRCVRDDAGAYEWKAWGSEGDLQCHVTFTLQIEERPPEARLQVLCQCSGEWTAQCGPPGLQYEWFLNRSVLPRTLAYMSEPGDVIILKSHVIGILTCYARRGAHGSNATQELMACTCPSGQNCTGGEGWRTNHGSTHYTLQKDQLCVDHKIFLLGCGAATVILTLSVAIHCLKVTAQRNPHTPELMPLNRCACTNADVSEEKKKNSKCTKMQETMYADVQTGTRAEEQPAGSQMEPFLQTFTMYSRQ